MHGAEFKVSLIRIRSDKKEGTVNEGICLLSEMNIDLINLRIVLILLSIMLATHFPCSYIIPLKMCNIFYIVLFVWTIEENLHKKLFDI